MKLIEIDGRLINPEQIVAVERFSDAEGGKYSSMVIRMTSGYEVTIRGRAARAVWEGLWSDFGVWGTSAGLPSPTK